MSAQGVEVENNSELEEIDVTSIPSQLSQGVRGNIEGQLQGVSKHMENISAFVMESSQLKVDALKCFRDNVAEMRSLQEETESKAAAFRNLVQRVGIAVGVTVSESN